MAKAKKAGKASKTPQQQYEKIEDLKSAYDDMKKSSEFADAYSRMDDDEELYFLEEYELNGYDGKTKVADVDNVTSNEPLVYAMAVKGILSSATRQTIVEGRLKGDKELPKGVDKPTLVEDFLDDVYAMADEILLNAFDYTIDDFIYEQIIIRGRIGAKIEIGMDGDMFMPYIIPYDTRYMAWDKGFSGLIWCGAEMERSKGLVKSEYGIEKDKSEMTVTELWDAHRREIYIDDELITEAGKPNPYGATPWVVAISQMSSHLQSTDAKEHRGESVYWQNRQLYPELNKTLTVLQSLNMETFRPPLAAYSPDGTWVPRHAPYGSRKITGLKRGHTLEELYPRSDLRQATRLFYSVLSAMMQRGSLPQVDFGNLQFPLSAVAISSLSEAKDKLIMLLINAISIFRMRCAYMIIKQFVAGGAEAEIGEQGRKRAYDPKQVEGDYRIRFTYSSISPEQNIANYAVANAAGGMVSEETKRRDIIRMQDWQKEEDKIRMERAEQLVPALAAINQAKAFVRDGDEVSAQVILAQLGITLEQLKSGKFETPQAPAETGSPEALVPLMGSRGAGQSPRQSSNKTATQMQNQLDVE